MQTQHLNAAGLCGFGEIVPDCPAEGYAAVRREFAPGEETEKLSASCPVVLEYGGGMSLLVLHGSETRAFYLDRIVRLEPETVFSIVPVGEHSAVIFHLPEGETLPSFITELTGITDLQLTTEGVEQEAAVEAFCHLLFSPSVSESFV